MQNLELELVLPDVGLALARRVRREEQNTDLGVQDQVAPSVRESDEQDAFAIALRDAEVAREDQPTSRLLKF